MYNKLRMYNFPSGTIDNVKRFISKTLETKVWVNCLAAFLTKIKCFFFPKNLRMPLLLKNQGKTLLNTGKYQ